MMIRYKKAALLALVLAAVGPASAEETFVGAFAEPRDGGNLDVARSTFDGTTALLVPRWHESEALGQGQAARRWRNLLFAIRGVKGKTVTFLLPAAASQSGVMIHNIDVASANLIEPVWSYQARQRQWQSFTSVDAVKPDDEDTPGATFPADSVVDRSGKINLRWNSSRREDYGWVFRNETPFEEDVVYVSINEQYPVLEFYEWLEREIFTHAWVQPTASQAPNGHFLIGYQTGGTCEQGSYSREIPDTPLYAFQIKEPGTQPKKLVMLVSGQHPYEGQNKAALQAALEWILDPHDPAAAAYRKEYVTLVYPLVNPTGELAGLWRGTANDVHRDINRNWHTTLVDPNENRGIDTVIIHKQAMTKDVAAIDLGQPYAVIDLHQNFGDQLPALHYVLHNRNPVAAAFVRRLQEQVDIADVLSNPPSKQTLRGYWQHHGAAMSLCIERSTYSTLGAEREFGRQLMRALAPATNAALVATTTTETLAPPAEDPATSDSTPLATLPLDSTAVYATHSTATETSTGSEGGNSHVHAVHHCEAEAETEAVSSPFSASDRIAAD